MAQTAVHLLVEMTIHDGQLEAFQSLAREMIAGSRAEAGTLGYEWYLSSDQKQCRLLETYASADALAEHFNGPVVQEMVPRLRQLVTVDRFEAYGDPGSEAGAMLAKFGTPVFAHWGGVKK
jgi:quinol monooxygenase YgiN